MHRSSRIFSGLFAWVGILAALALGVPDHAAAASFSDVPSSHFAYEAVEYLKSRNMLAGYADGTFRPQAKVNRAEALKIIVAPIIPDNVLAKYKTTGFADVARNDWFLPYVGWAEEENVIQGPPKTTSFSAARPVTKAEFIKMFMASRDIDPLSFSDVKLPLSKDVGNVDEWFYPYIRYAVASSMTTAASDGSYSPNREITRSDVALLLHRYFLYRLGERTQTQLSETERELSKTIDALAAGNVTGADYTSARALLMMRGANEVKPEEPTVRAVVKITEGYRALVRAYKASKAKKWNDVIKLSSDAGYLGDQAKKMSPSTNTLGTQLQQYSKSFADQARVQK